MPPTPQPGPALPACGLSAEEINERIRALFRRRQGWGLTADERLEYEALLGQWAEAVRAETEPVGGWVAAA